MTPPSDEYLMAWLAGYLAGHDRGYWERVAEENATGPPGKVFTFGRWYDQAKERQRHDQETRDLLELASANWNIEDG